MSKGIDYSKWDKIDVSDDESQSGAEQVEDSEGNDWDDEEQEEQEIRAKLQARLAVSQQQQQEEQQPDSGASSGKPRVRTLGPGGKVTIGPDGVSYGGMPEATVSPFGNNKKRKEDVINKAEEVNEERQVKEQPTPEPLSNVPLPPPPTEEDQKWWKQNTSNGTWCSKYRYALSQTKDSVQINLLLQYMDFSLGSVDTRTGRAEEPPKCCKLSAKAIGNLAVVDSSLDGDENGGGVDLTKKTLEIQLCKASGSDILAPLQSVGPWAKATPTETSAAPQQEGGRRAVSLAGRIIKLPLQYPVKNSEDLMEGCWELITVRALDGIHPYSVTNSSTEEGATLSSPSASSASAQQAPGWMRFLSISLKKEDVGQGTYLWWDRVFAQEQDPSLDVATDIEGRDMAKAEALKAVWTEAEERFKKKDQEE